jgi:DNA-binding CsgD family transcriptional regulator
LAHGQDNGEDVDTPAFPTARQKQVLHGAIHGLTAKEVARTLGISHRTVEGHLRTLRKRTGARSIGELCALAVAKGWAAPVRQPRGGLPADGRQTRGTEPILAEMQSCSEKIGFLDNRDTNVQDFSSATRGTGGRPTVMTPQRIEAARELLPTHTITEIARKLGVSRGTLYAHMNAITMNAGSGRQTGESFHLLHHLNHNRRAER